MMIEQKYVFDLDNTLVYTDILNNDSYNYALNILGLPEINNVKRITREVVFVKYPYISMTLRNDILELKQDYFKKNLHVTVPNNTLLKLLLMQKKANCILWTSANSNRVKETLKYYDIEEEFISVIFSKKQNIDLELEKIYKIFKCKLEQIIFYEDNKEIIKRLLELGANVVIVDN